jgi:hypothetical protein
MAGPVEEGEEVITEQLQISAASSYEDRDAPSSSSASRW